MSDLPLHGPNYKDVRFYFLVPVLEKQGDHSSLNASLKQYILDLQTTCSSESKSNSGGWHSSTDFLNHLPKDLEKGLLEIIHEGIHESMSSVIKDYTPCSIDLCGWANVLGKGNFHYPHTHPGAIWSGVYYVDDGGDPSSQLILSNPIVESYTYQHPLNPFHYNLVKLTPATGKLILFPSWLQHSVAPYQGSSERISIAFNAFNQIK